jgi:hypothetical protein
MYRTSSRRNSKRSNRRNWTTDLQVQNERLFTPQLPQSESPQDENVCIPASPTVHFYAEGARTEANIPGVAQRQEEDDEEAQLRQLQAELAM